MDKLTDLPSIKLEGYNLFLNGNGQAIWLRPMEARLLATLLARPNQVVSRATLMREVWETNFLDDTRTLDVHIHWLRQKIETNPACPRCIEIGRASYRERV